MILTFLKRKPFPLKTFFGVFLIAAILSFAPLYNQLQRNGTIGHPEGDKISVMLENIAPFFKHKSVYYPETQIIQRSRIGYIPRGQSFLDVVEKYLFYPKIYNLFRYPAKQLKFQMNLYFLMTSLILLSLGYLYFYKKNSSFLFLIISIQSIDLALSYFLTTGISKYHSMNLALLTMVYLAGVFNLIFLLRKINAYKIIIPLLVIVVTLSVSIPYLSYIHPTFWMNSGRNDNKYSTAYEKMGNWVQENINENALFLTGSAAFAKYARRDMIWISGSRTNPEIWKIINGDEIENTKKAMEKFNIKYIFIETRQIDWGPGDTWPSQGLPKLLESEYFKEIYTININESDNEKFSIYEVI